jgi:hypothetical protein
MLTNAARFFRFAIPLDEMLALNIEKMGFTALPDIPNLMERCNACFSPK